MTDHLVGRSVGDDLALRQHHGAVGHPGRELDVVGGQHDGVTESRPVPAESRRAGPCSGSRGPGSVRRGGAPAAAGASTMASAKRQSLSLREVTRMAIRRHPGQHPVQGPRSSCPGSSLEARSACATLVRDRFTVEEQSRILGHEADPRMSSAGFIRCGSRPTDPHGTTARFAPAREGM